MAESSSAPGPLIVKGLVTFLVAFAPLITVFAGPLIIRSIAPIAGWALKRNTEGRRAQLLSLMSEDEAKYAEQKEKDPELKGTLGGKGKRMTADASSLGISDGSKNGTRTDWGGIVGFFHPFWYVTLRLLLLLRRRRADIRAWKVD